ncbi:MAG: ATP synthase F1 subunit gamma [Erysipelotrichaceae bacterium]|jgi:F-type H+-transporting ATPase subunit gamma|nr:ATP synthase F1 subunit gamma [Bacilli bacterium]NLV29100.1 ATP synthase F1 subunit gamma [Erysipelotrichaceae bacterium]HPY79558.1 ATP synthase F1 subunit gamma [Bacilli bacterium]HQA56038.1 ATP synthase F1 subunit gamma [Bacilli bacterium]
MSQQINRIKQRIKTINGALKVTSAMKLVSTVKLKKWKNKMFVNRTYSSQIEEITNEVFRFAKKVKSPFIEPNLESRRKLYIIVSSTLGLCGAYNSNIFKLADITLKENDELIVLGKKGLNHFEKDRFTMLKDFSSYSTITDQGVIRQLSQFVTEQYQANKYQEIHLIYSSYKNSFVFVPKDVTILPVKKPEENNELDFAPIMEPTPQKLVDSLLPLYLKTLIYSKLLESEVCEHAARRNAMENATDNAQELIDKLTIELSKARQSSITEEITEIVSTARAQ